MERNVARAATVGYYCDNEDLENSRFSLFERLFTLIDTLLN